MNATLYWLYLCWNTILTGTEEETCFITGVKEENV